MWFQVLGSAVVFESETAMNAHKATSGRTHVMAAPLATSSEWRVERSDFSRAGITAKK